MDLSAKSFKGELRSAWTCLWEPIVPAASCLYVRWHHTGAWNQSQWELHHVNSQSQSANQTFITQKKIHCWLLNIYQCTTGYYS